MYVAVNGINGPRGMGDDAGSFGYSAYEWGGFSPEIRALFEECGNQFLSWDCKYIPFWRLGPGCKTQAQLVEQCVMQKSGGAFEGKIKALPTPAPPPGAYTPGQRGTATQDEIIADMARRQKEQIQQEMNAANAAIRAEGGLPPEPCPTGYVWSKTASQCVEPSVNWVPWALAGVAALLLLRR